MKRIAMVLMLLPPLVGLYSKTLEIEVPKANIIGTPAPIKSMNLEPKAPRPKIEVPDGITNVALGKPVTSSDDFPLFGELSFVTDGDKVAMEGNSVELYSGPQWVQIDLGKECDIYAIAVWHFMTQERVYFGVVVELSNDPDFRENVVAVYNNDIDNSSKRGKGESLQYVEANEGKVIVVNPPQKARYVRLYSNGNHANDKNHYVEVEVYGK